MRTISDRIARIVADGYRLTFVSLSDGDVGVLCQSPVADGVAVASTASGPTPTDAVCELIVALYGPEGDA